MLTIRPAQASDTDAVWIILEPIIRRGETYALPRDLTREAGLNFWFGRTCEVFVAESNGGIVGTAFIKPNQLGGGSHVANAGYATAEAWEGHGVARALCLHTLDRARECGYRAMQFNFVVSTNVRAVRLWQSLGFASVGVLPAAFEHPVAGRVDVFVMYRQL